MSAIDLGIRCDRHVGEVFPPRCVTCDALTAEWKALNPPRYPDRPIDDLYGPVDCSIDAPCQRCLDERGEG